jgi:hypothetical protein
LLAGFLAEKHTLGRSDVEAVVAEIDYEVGVDVSVPEHHESRREPVAALGVAANSEPLAMLAPRVERLERNVDELLRIVRAIVEPERSLPDEEPRPRSRRSSKGG